MDMADTNAASAAAQARDKFSIGTGGTSTAEDRVRSAAALYGTNNDRVLSITLPRTSSETVVLVLFRSTGEDFEMLDAANVPAHHGDEQVLAQIAHLCAKHRGVREVVIGERDVQGAMIALRLRKCGYRVNGTTIGEGPHPGEAWIGDGERRAVNPAPPARLGQGPHGLDIEIEVGSFSWALALLKKGRRLRRRGWEDEVSVFLCSALTPKSLDKPIHFEPFVVLRKANGDVAPWLPSQTDMLADDWRVLNP